MTELLAALFCGSAKLPDGARERIVSAGAEIVPALVEVLLDTELACEGARGDGYAPTHAATLLAAIGDPAAVEPLIAVIERGEPDEILYERALFVIPHFGAAALERLLQAHDRTDDRDRRGGLCDALARCGVHDDRVRERLLGAFERDPEIMIGSVAEYGDPTLLPAVVAAVDARELGDTPMRNVGLLELAEAIERLGGALTDTQRRKVGLAEEIRVDAFAEIDSAASEGDLDADDELLQQALKVFGSPLSSAVVRAIVAAADTPTAVLRAVLDSTRRPPTKHAVERFLPVLMEVWNTTPRRELGGLSPEAVHRTPAVAEKKIGRNEPCPCGSGKKYKKCCVGKPAAR